ncbi:MAG: sensor histidine kinase/response regulator [Caulobacter sp.]|nr:sensor histidine kinase/response regulator [Caulobacter sp.]
MTIAPRTRWATPEPAKDPAQARILIVDDDERNAFAAVQALETLGHELVVARSGEEALRALLVDEFAVILLDLHMPGMDGYETAQMIRSRKKNASTPIVFLTAIFRDEAHVFQAYSAGAVDVVFKPVDPFILRSKVSVLVNLYLKTAEVERRAAEAHRLLDENARVTAAKEHAERALQRSRQREEAILRSLPIVFHARTAAPPFAPSFVSDSIEPITGFSPARFVEEGAFGASRIHPDDLDRVIETISAAVHTGAYACEFRWQHADGSWLHLLDQGVLAPAGEGEQEIFGVIMDATERRSLEEQLAQARKMEAVGQLTGGVAHDFNNLLTVVLGNVDMLTRRDEDAVKRAVRIDAVRQAAERGRDLTQQLLAFSRRQHLTPVTLDACVLIRDFASLLRQAVGEAITVELDLAKTPLPVHVDRTQLETALLNLAVNARDAMEAGGQLTITAAKAGESVVLEVRDTGSGMTPQVRDHVFEPFFTTKEVGKGSGLGLSQVYGFVSQSHGAVSIDSAPGQGTAVRLVLPLSADLCQVREEPPDFTDAATGHERILVVEDEATVRDLAVEMLRSLGYQIVTAGDAAEAMAVLREDEAIDLLFSDVVMPGGESGVGLAQAARTLRPALPILLTSGYVAEPAGLSGADFPLIDKPYDVVGLSQQLRSLLDGPAKPKRGRRPRHGAAAARA